MIIYGKNTVKEAINSKRRIFNLFIDEKNLDLRLLNFLKKIKFNFKSVDKQFLNNLTGINKHQGIVAKVDDYKYSSLEICLNNVDSEKIQRFLILDQIQDPHNFGAILRTVEASGFEGIIVSHKHQAPINSTVAKIASGALEYVKIFLVANIYQTILKLKKHNILIISADEKSSYTLEKIPLKRSLAIIIGNEGKGIRFLLKKNSDLLVKIPMQGKINSLNVSVAAALFIYSILLSKNL
ncbi:23S rRNA (guanosine(2251)-2'-O)-methyltransferase RlmB [Candidatus Phytoplasma prunorum]|uniref:23S rRNA (guanosine(2251)-2'-O)-methyltransferase RlmB n=1 Tax=Candidatus Phytoplasma prunorum TaxID=47565 RepID=UPI002FF0B8E1